MAIDRTEDSLLAQLRRRVTGASVQVSIGLKGLPSGAFTLAGSIRQRPVAQLLENVWMDVLGKPV